MPIICEIVNPFEPDRDQVKTWVKDGTTPLQYVERQFGKGGDFEHPTLLIVNGGEFCRCEWGEIKLEGDDVAVFRRLPQWAAVAAFAADWGTLVLAGASLAYSFLVKPPDFNERDNSPSQFNLSGQRNLIKLGEPIKVPYGRNRIFPDYAARSYSKFINNDQFLYQLFCIGQGVYNIEDLQIEDTPIANFDEVTYEVYEPGDQVTLFPDNIITSEEVANIELLAPNDPNYAGESGPFVANPVGTTTDKLEWDVVFPQGLGRTNSSGDFREKTVTATFSYREIDDSGSPVGSWVDVPFSKTLTTSTPQRFTVSTSVAAGRYEVKAVRTSDSEQLARVLEQINWYQLRAELPSTKDYGDVTILAVKSKATNNLNDSSQNRVNVIATRKLPIWNGSAWSVPTSTRSPVWAFCDILRSAYGGNIEDAKIDLPKMLTLDAIYSSRADNFDWVFDRKTTIYQACKTVLTAGRATMLILGNKFTAFRDGEQSIPVAAFAPENIREGTFEQSLSFQPPDDYDGIEASYTDASTWTEESVTALIGSDAGANTKKIVFPGITNRDKVYREALYTRAKEIFQRERVSFSTGPEGRIVTFGDLCVVSHDVPEWGQSGFVASIAVNLRTVTLEEPLRSTQGDRIAFRDKNGEIDGPYVCTVDPSDPYTVTTTTDISGDFLFTDNEEPPIYFFGTAATIYKRLLLIEKTSNRESDTESLSFVNYDERIYQYDSYTAEPLANAPIPESAPALPAITGLTLTQTSSSPLTVQAVWSVAVGAVYYIYQISYDNVSWSPSEVTTGELANISSEQGRLYVRVAAVNQGQGPWSSASIYAGVDQWVLSDGDSLVDSEGDTLVFLET